MAVTVIKDDDMVVEYPNGNDFLVDSMAHLVVVDDNEKTLAAFAQGRWARVEVKPS